MDKEITVKEAIDRHQLWLDSNGGDGERFDLSGTNLQKANFQNCDLSKANLTNAILKEASLPTATLREAGFISSSRGDDRPEHLKSVYSRRDAYIRSKDRSR